ncbi:MAG TPA: polysaccharide biosynthesis/export family protein [Puia sp.]|nr:polysaccharide biosynthesis/export family protein [Puia sp.]
MISNLYLVKNKPLVFFFCLFIWAFGMMSCGNMRQLTYMQGKFDTAALSQINVKEPQVQKGDLLSIIVYSDNPAATTLYNQPLIVVSNATGAGAAMGGEGAAGGGASASSPVGNSPSTPGYLVDEYGNIQFQGLGILHVEGLTRQQLRDTLDARLQPYLTHPYYTIRFLNYKFTMLGEIQHPGIFSIPGDRINLLEALGLAGDMTFYGRRDNVLIIRENNGKREYARLDLTKPEIVASPYFYLQQKDVVIVEASKKKAAASDQVTTRNLSIALAAASTIAVIYSIFKR